MCHADYLMISSKSPASFSLGRFDPLMLVNNVLRIRFRVVDFFVGKTAVHRSPYKLKHEDSFSSVLPRFHQSVPWFDSDDSLSQEEYSRSFPS